MPGHFSPGGQGGQMSPHFCWFFTQITYNCHEFSVLVPPLLVQFVVLPPTFGLLRNALRHFAILRDWPSSKPQSCLDTEVCCLWHKHTNIFWKCKIWQIRVACACASLVNAPTVWASLCWQMMLLSFFFGDASITRHFAILHRYINVCVYEY